MYEGPETSTRIFEIKCVGDSNVVADMLEDIYRKYIVMRKCFIR
ncbi:hypothetical protein ACTFJW_02595 [Clostridium cagae]